MNQVKIGKFIAECRKKNNLTQIQLAEKLNITDRAVSKWETGKGMPDSSIMLELCNELDITVNELLSGEIIEMDNYDKIAEENLLKLNKSNEHKKKTLMKFGIVIVVLVLVIIIGIMAYILNNMIKISKNNLNHVLNGAQEVHEMNRAIHEAGFELEKQEDGSYLLVEKADI